MAEKKKRSSPYAGLAIAVVAMLLLWLGLHLYTFDYKVPLPERKLETTRLSTLRSLLSLETNSEFGTHGPIAKFEFVNISKNIVAFVNPQDILPLFEMELLYKTENGSFEPAPQNMTFARRQAQSAATEAAFKPGIDAITELPPDTSSARRFHLIQYFDFRKPGTYQLRITYNPERLPDEMGPQFQQYGLSSERITNSILFEWPPKAPTPAPAR